MACRAFATQIVEREMIAKRRTALLPRRRRRLIVLGSQPVYADIGVPPENYDQLTRVVLGVSQVIQQELANVQVVPRETAALEGPIVSQLLECFVAFPEAVIGVLKQLDPGEGLFRRGDDPTVLLIVSGQKVGFVYVEISCLERLRIVGQVEVRVEQRMVG